MSQAVPYTTIPTSSTSSTNLLAINGIVVDKLTGEIHGLDDRPSILSGPLDYQSSLRDCRSVDDFENYLRFVDRRKLPPHSLHSLNDEVDYAHGVWRRGETDCRITKPQQRLLTQLQGLVQYHNVIFMTQVDLAQALNTVKSNLMKKLKVLEDAKMLRITTCNNGNIRRGEIKLAINPRLVFRGADKIRERYIENWYHPTGTLHFTVEKRQHANMAA
ncbi:TPA: hypothetical protein L6A98_11375 [Pseudomonas aeruginosa]|nr:hypothetical protein [Pseudomonas aeruginosa]